MTATTITIPRRRRHSSRPSPATAECSEQPPGPSGPRCARSARRCGHCSSPIGLAIGFGALVACHPDQQLGHPRPRREGTLRPDLVQPQRAVPRPDSPIGVLGVLMVTSEYATGQIRATLAATPQRLTVLAAKATTFVGVVFVVGLVSSFSAFGIGQAIFSSKGIEHSLSDPGVLRAVIGGALYLAAVGVLGLGLGTIIRRTAGAITAFVGLLMIVPIVTSFLPASWNERVGKFFRPGRHGRVQRRPRPDVALALDRLRRAGPLRRCVPDRRWAPPHPPRRLKENHHERSPAHRLYAAAGICAAAAGAIFIAVQINHPPADVAHIGTTEMMIRETAKAVMAALALVGITGMFVRNRHRFGALGLAGYLLFSIGYLAMFAVQCIAGYVLPTLALTSPAYAQDVLDAAVGNNPAGDIGNMQYLLLVAGMGYAIGGLLFGIALFRARILARWASALLAYATVAVLALTALPDSFTARLRSRLVSP